MVAQPTLQIVKMSVAKQGLDQLVDEVSRHTTRIVVEQSGKAVAGIVSVEDLQRLDRLDQQRAERFRILDEIGEAFKDAPAEELEREVERALADVRAKRRFEQEASDRR